VTNPIEGKIGWENKAKKEVALDLVPAPADEGKYTSFVCPPNLHMSVGGSVLVPVTPVNKMLTKLTLKYKTSTKGHQIPEKFEGEEKDVLLTSINGKAPEQSGITVTSTQTGEEAAEVNTVV
jgi:hypothetical protein